MFESKKDAEAYDKMLELGEQFTALLEDQIKGIDESKAESFGLLLAKNKELIIQACKGRPQVLEEIINPSQNTVTPIGTAAGS